ncbi:unnamed protein product [Camellia sinensis]
MKFKSLLVEAMMYLITDIDEEELMGDLDALEADVGMETEGDGVPAYKDELEEGAHLATSTNRACSTSSTSWQSQPGKL